MISDITKKPILQVQYSTFQCADDGCYSEVGDILYPTVKRMTSKIFASLHILEYSNEGEELGAI